MTERKTCIFNIQKYNTYDGHGIRTLVFFKGCPLRCIWCSNPEGQAIGFQVLFKESMCVHCEKCVDVCPRGVHAMQNGKHVLVNPKACIGCRACEKACYRKVLAIVGEKKSTEELLATIEEDKIFYDISGGGVTLSGGEVFMQPQAAIDLLKANKQHGINTVVETCGYTSLEVIQQASAWVDTFLFDIKHMDTNKHHAITGVYNESILRNLQWLLDNNKYVKIRIPLIKGLNDDVKMLEQLATFLQPYIMKGNFMGIEILPYHKFGISKYAQLGLEYKVQHDGTLTDEELQCMENVFTQRRIHARIVKH